METSVFHSGEQQVQRRLGVQGIEAWASTVVRPYLPEQHRAFHTSLPFLVAAARDAEGRPWATLLAGDSGFVTSPDDRRLRIAALPVQGDALEHALHEGADVGILGIDFATRRRNRVNGRVNAEGDALAFVVEQSFGNCPKHIHLRNWSRVEPTPGEVLRGDTLSATQRAWVTGADTLFIASGHRGQGQHAAFGMDASHRGGEPGFVGVTSPSRLVIPDYSGNNHFNTIGNLVLDGRVGLLFVDFRSGSMLQVSGRATIDWDSDAVGAFAGAQRLIVVDVEAVVETRSALPLRWDDDAEGMRAAQVVRTEPLSADVTSLYLAPADGAPIDPFSAGQHIAVGLEVNGSRVTRSYSLSNAPGDAVYRISVKREPRGVASRALHDDVALGDSVQVGQPSGDFVLHGGGAVVLVSAGVGVTPVMSMLADLANTPDRRVVFVHSARDGAHHPFADAVRGLAAASPGTTVHVAYTQPRPDDVGYDSVGRIDEALLGQLQVADADYYLCGPVAFMAGVQDMLERLDVAPEKIHTESFG